MIWIQLTRPINARKGDILILRINKIQQYKSGIYQWVVTPLGKKGNMDKPKAVNPPPAKEG